MNIFDGLDPELMQQMLGGYQGQQQAPAGQSQPFSVWSPMEPQLDMNFQQFTEDSKAPVMPGIGQSDVSGLANYGMTPPPLDNPLAAMGGLMGMANRAQEPKQQTQMPQGGLMAYLQQIGAI